MGAKCCKVLLDREQEVDFSLTLLNLVLYVHSNPTLYPKPPRKERTAMATVPPTIEERLARLEGVYDHLASKADLAELRAVLKDDIARVESDLKAEMAELKGSVKILLVVMTSGLALLNIVLRFWPS